MAGSSSEESGASRSLEGLSNGQQRSGEALAEWRSSEQVENGITSTSPPYWDTDDDDDSGPKPSELYGKYTWKIDKFSQINKRELRSNAFEVGGYKWYILIYPQGCDVCNHLSLFLCVANHDKLLPGWSHFAQFTIAVVNKDPKKSKYSDTLHRFWKKEHDWGWKKFMELSKVLDGFVDADTLIIKAQVQVIRERADRPFKCLDCQYRRELVRVYLSNVEQICRRFVEERRGRLGKLIEDKARWSSFCAFWSGIDQTGRRRMSREKSDLILKVVVKHFFIEKEVTSTLVMDSLYSGLKALEGQGQIKGKKPKGKSAAAAAEEPPPPTPIVRMENDTFILVDDVLLLLERAALEPLPPKDEKGPQNRTKDGGSGEDFSKDSIERDERRLTELGRRTIEIFVLAHIFSKIEVAYQEAVALKRQEELIREEEAAWMAGTDQKSKRGAEKKSKKKQGKQKRNNRKSKDKGRDEKSEEKPQRHEDTELVLEKTDTIEDVSDDVSDSVDCVPETLLRPDSDDRDSSPVNWDTDTSEPHRPTGPSSSGPNGLSAAVPNGARKSPSAMDDSSSTCSTDSLPSVVNGPQNPKNQKSPTRAKAKRGKAGGEVTRRANGMQRQPSDVTTGGSKVDEPESDVVLLQDRLKWLEHHVTHKEEAVPVPKKLNGRDTAVEPERPMKEKTAATVTASSPKSSSKPTVHPARKPSSEPEPWVSPKPKTATPKPTEKSTHKSMNGQGGAPPTEKPVSRTVEKAPVEKPAVKPVAAAAMSRPLSAPLVPGPKPNAGSAVVSTVQTAAPVLSRSASTAGYLGPDLSAATQNFAPPSYRNAMMGSPAASAAAASTSFGPKPTVSPQPPMIPMFRPERVDPNGSVQPGFSFGMINGSQWMEPGSRHDPSSSLLTDIRNIDLYAPAPTRSLDRFTTDYHPGSSGRQAHGMLADEFPHLDIINDLLDDEYAMPPAAAPWPHHLNHHQFTYMDQGPSTSSGMFDRARTEFYGGGGGQFDFPRDMVPQPPPNLQPYMNEQWQMGGGDLSYGGGLRNMDNDGYPYHVPDYTMGGVNGYTVYRPSNGQ